MHYRLWKSRATGQWHWRLMGANNEVIASGESYKRKIDAKRAIMLLQSSVLAPIREVK